MSIAIAVLWLCFALVGGKAFFFGSLVAFATQIAIADMLRDKQYFGAAVLVFWLPCIAALFSAPAASLMSVAFKAALR